MSNKLTKPRIIIIALVVIAAIFLGFKYFVKGSNSNYILYRVKSQEFIKSVDAKGTIEAQESRLIKAPSSLHGNTRIIDMVDEGAYVDSGDFLIQFDESKFQEDLESAKNNYENAVADYESKQANIKKEMADLQSQLKIEKYNLEQMELRAENSIYEAENKQKEIEYSLKKSRISYQQLKNQIESTKDINQKELKKARLKMEQAKIKLEEVKDDIGRLRLTSPGEGLVVYKTIWGPSGREKLKIGATPWRSMTLMEIPDQNKRKVMLTVNESDISQIEKGQRVKIKVEAVKDTTFYGQVTKIASLASTDHETDKKVFDIEVEMDEYDERLKPGMSTRCEIIVEKVDQALSVPIDAIVQNNGEKGVLRSSGKFQKLETGISNSDFIIVKSGLEAGDRIRMQKTGQLESTERQKEPESNRSRDDRRRFRR